MIEGKAQTGDAFITDWGGDVAGLSHTYDDVDMNKDGRALIQNKYGGKEILARSESSVFENLFPGSAAFRALGVNFGSEGGICLPDDAIVTFTKANTRCWEAKRGVMPLLAFIVL